MNRTITFNELRKIKDSLPTGSMHRIADELNLSVETVRNFFGGHNFKDGYKIRAVTREWESIRSCYGPYCLSDNMILT